MNAIRTTTLVLALSAAVAAGAAGLNNASVGYTLGTVEGASRVATVEGTSRVAAIEGQSRVAAIEGASRVA